MCLQAKPKHFHDHNKNGFAQIHNKQVLKHDYNDR